MAKKGAIKVTVYGTADMKQIDRARKQLNELERGAKKNAGGFLGAMTKMGGGLRAVSPALIAVGAAAAIMDRKLIASAKNASTSNARIENITKSMGLFGNQADAVSQRLIKLAESQARQTGIDTNAIKQTQAKLMTFKELAATADETGGAFDRANQAALDLAAAGFGEATQNAVQLGKALNDPIKGITALAEAGVTFTEQEKDKIKALVESGKMLEAQDTLLRAIETQVGGTAVATANATDKMKVAWEQISASLGVMLLPAVERLADYVVNAAEAMSQAKDAAREWAETNERTYSSIDELKSPITAITAANAYWTEKGKEAARTGEEQMSVWRKMVTPLGALAYEQGKTAGEAEKLAAKTDAAGKTMSAATGPAGDLANAMGDSAAATDGATEANDKLIRSMEGLMVASDDLSGRMRTLTELNLDQQEAAIRVRDAERRLAEVMKDSKRTADDVAKAQIDLERAKLRAKDATADLTQAEIDLDMKTSEIAKNVAFLEWLDSLTDRANKADGALARAARSAAGLSSSGGGTRAGVQEYGAGGIVSSPTYAMVGERNHPEYVITTEPAFRSRSLALLDSLSRDLGVSGSSTTTNRYYNIDARGATDPAAVHAAVLAAIDEAERRSVSSSRLRAQMIG